MAFSDITPMAAHRSWIRLNCDQHSCAVMGPDLVFEMILQFAASRVFGRGGGALIEPFRL